MKKITFFFLILLSIKLQSQINLLPNPSFETTLSCPASAGCWNSCANWNNISFNTGFGLWGTPDYFHPCGSGGTAPPATFAGTCNVHTGNAMAALIMYNVPFPNYREYLSTQLNCSMQPGLTYTLSFWITNGTGIISPWVIKNIGVHFSTIPLTQNGWSVINVIPQCEVTSIISTSVWTQYTFTVIPTATWNYLTIGSFRNDVSNTPTMFFPNPGGNPSSYANYFFDDIVVLAPANTTSTIVMNSSSGNFSLCSGQQLTLSASGANTYTWNGATVSPTLVVSPTVTSIYTVSSLVSSGCSSTLSTNVKTITVSPQPVLSVNGSSTICRGQTTTLTATGANSYSWNNGATTSSIVVSPSVNAIYSVIGSNSSGCVSNLASSQVIVSNSLNIAISGNTLICVGTIASFTASGASSYSWNGVSSGPIFTLMPSGSMQFTVAGFNNVANCSGIKTFNVLLSECLGITESNQNTNIKLYPNPIQNKVTIEGLPESTVNLNYYVYNALGKLILHAESITSDGNLSVPTDNWINGVYFIQLFENNKLFYSSKIIKQ
jgi:hypothetical protein